MPTTHGGLPSSKEEMPEGWRQGEYCQTLLEQKAEMPLGVHSFLSQVSRQSRNYVTVIT